MSGGFTERSLDRKLAELNNTAISIQQLSLWLVHHKKHYPAIVRTWQNSLLKSESSRKLTLLYLANDVLQNVRKSKPEFVSEFGMKMIEVFNHLAELDLDEQTVNSIHRLILIWAERQILDRKLIAILTSIWKNRDNRRRQKQQQQHYQQQRSREASPHTPPPRSPQSQHCKYGNNDSGGQPNPSAYGDVPGSLSPKRHATEPSADLPDAKRHQADRERVEDNQTEHRLRQFIEGNSTEGEEADDYEDEEEALDPPDPEELIQAIQGLEETATGDAKVREEIAKLSPEVSDVKTAGKITNAAEGEELISRVQDATKLLEDYNERLESELRERRRVGRMIHEFLSAQKSLITGLEERIDTYKDKLDKVQNVEEEIRRHLSSLPNIPSTNSQPNQFI